jgi:hypothetical protein
MSYLYCGIGVGNSPCRENSSRLSASALPRRHVGRLACSEYIKIAFHRPPSAAKTQIYPTTCR